MVYSALDSWLAIRRKSTINYLNPLQFAVDVGIDSEIALAVFAICTYPDINLLRAKYIVECSNCKKTLGIYYSLAEIADSHECSECHCANSFAADDVIVYFELLQEPQEPIVDQPMKEAIESVIGSRGKSRSLRTSDLEKSSNIAVRGLLARYDERFESAK